MDTTGNDDSTVGAIENCGEITAVGDTYTFDLVIKGVDPDDKIRAYQFDIDYDSSVIQIGIDDDGDTLFDEDPADSYDNDGDTLVDEDPWDSILVDAAGSTPPDDVTILSRIDSSGAAGFFELYLPETIDSATFVATDGTASPWPPDNHESGDGVLARITVTAVGTGQSPLLIPSTLGGQDGNVDIIVMAGDGPLFGAAVPVAAFQGGEVVVGGSCLGGSADSDSDGYTDTDEGDIGTDPSDSCADTPDPDDEVDDKWPPDFDDNQVINVLDVGEVLPPYFGASVTTAGPRRDIVVDGFINVLDVGMTLPPYFGSVCA